MPFQNCSDGLYLVTQWSFEKKCDHYGILDIGNRLRHPQLDGRCPMVIHQTPPSIRWDRLEDTGRWSVLGKITDEEYAILRLIHALSSPWYSLFGHNCEHFARFIATGVRESKQLQAVGAWAGVVALVVLVLKSAPAHARAR